LKFKFLYFLVACLFAFMELVPVAAGTTTEVTGTVPAEITVTSIWPASGHAAGGSGIAVIGTHFTGATAVTFGLTAATSFTIISDTLITANAPPGAGTVHVTVTTPGGTSPSGYCRPVCLLYRSGTDRIKGHGDLAEFRSGSRRNWRYHYWS
jgi:hypothetical protein